MRARSAGSRQIGVATDEQQPQDVVAILGAIEPLCERILCVVELRREIALGEHVVFATPSHRVDREVAADQDENQ